MLNGFTRWHIFPHYVGYYLLLQPLNEQHSDWRLGNFRHRTFGRELSSTLELIGCFLLLIACINFINLTTAQAVNRAREVGVRKVLGGTRRQLLFQFFGETGLACLAAVIVAVVLALSLLPALNGLLDSHLSAALFRDHILVLTLAGAFIGTSLLAGSCFRLS